MKTIANNKKKLSLNLQTLLTLSGSALDNAVGGVARPMGIVSTDTPSACFKCRPPIGKPQPPIGGSLITACPPTIKG
jgi:hypothetical protein